ncbi:MAG: hypothetical protein AAFN94_05880 [Pseudomonadota bacterium]
MPDFDSGHIFLTTMAPILPGAPEGDGDDTAVSYEQRVRIALARLPTANQSPATDKGAFNSPFARNTRNHLARMFVLNDVIYNGRNTMNPITAKLTGNDQMVPQHVDRLKAPYLVFCADVDAIVSDGDPLPTKLSAAEQRKVRAAYARKLWETMQEELSALYSNCYGFDRVKTADDFADYLDKCHVETTMPFHDYYLDLEKAAFNILPFKPLLIAVGVPLVITLLALLLRLLGVDDMPILGWSTFWTFVIGGLITAGIGFLAVKFAIWNGEKPLAPAKYDDLPSVLKGLYIQQNFSEFFIENQGLPPDQLHAAFGEFVAKHKPQNRQSMTQKPGVISSQNPDNVTT